MESVELLDLTLLGSSMRIFQESMTDITCDSYVLHMEHILEKLEKLEFGVSLSSYSIEKFKQIINLAKKESVKSRALSEIEGVDIKDLKQSYRDWHAVITAEARSKKAYIVSGKRMDIKKLLTDVSSIFATSCYQKLPAIAQYDFAEAGKSIAFSMPTAAAFHILRGTESVLRAYYIRHVKTRRMKEDQRMWGPILLALKTKKKVSKNLLEDLQIIKNSYRNPTQHPEMIYDLDMAQDLFGRCIDVVNQMAKDL